MTVAGVVLILAGVVALAVLATMVPFGPAGLFLVAALAVVALIGGGDR